MTEDTSTPRRGLHSVRPPKLPLHTDISKARLPKLPLSPFLDSSGQPPKLLLRLDIFKRAAAKVEQFVAWVSAISSHLHLLLCLPIALQVQEGHVNSRISASVDVGAPMVHRMVQKGDMATDVSAAMATESFTTTAGVASTATVRDAATARKTETSAVTVTDASTATVSGKASATATGIGDGASMIEKGSPSSNPATARAKAASGLERVSQRPTSS